MERSIEMEHGWEVVVVRTMAKDSSTIVVSGGSASVQTVLRDYELTMVNLKTYYSFANFRCRA